MSKPKRKMPKKGSQITVIHDGTHDLSRIKEIIERYGLKVEFRLVVPSRLNARSLSFYSP